MKKLGFGLMRLPYTDPSNRAAVDREAVKRMVDTFLDHGFGYFDTAYPYQAGASEGIFGELVAARHPRTAYELTTKLPIFLAERPEDYDRYFAEQLQRCRVDYFDNYLLHGLGEASYGEVERLDGFGFLARKKAEGRVRRIGFSYHGGAALLEQILTQHPETELVQLQINYVDWESEGVQSRKCYEVARKYNKPVIIMEPVRGGSLAIMPPQVQEVFKKAEPEMSVASWAIRYAASLEGVLTVLSGMSTEEQLNDNVSYMEDFKPLDEAERATVQQVVDILNSLPTIPCTACKYCVDGCPQKINIPSIFRTMNDLTLYNNEAGAKRSYANATKEGGKAGDCIQCGNCEAHCPQKIEIIETLKKAAAIFG